MTLSSKVLAMVLHRLSSFVTIESTIPSTAPDTPCLIYKTVRHRQKLTRTLAIKACMQRRGESEHRPYWQLRDTVGQAFWGRRYMKYIFQLSFNSFAKRSLSGHSSQVCCGTWARILGSMWLTLQVVFLLEHSWQDLSPRD